MAPDAATAKLMALLCATKHRAQDLSTLLARCILQYGLSFVRRLCRQLAVLLQHWQRSAQLRLRTVGFPLQHLNLTGTRLAADRLGRRAMASAVLALNSGALRMAARQLITISLSRGQEGEAGQAYTCHLRLLGGLIWLQFGLRRQLPASAPEAAAASPAKQQQEGMHIQVSCTNPAPEAASDQGACSPQQAQEGGSRRPPALVTSSTESFKSGLASYAQLPQAPKRAGSPLKSAKAHPAASAGNSAAECLASLASAAEEGVDSLCRLQCSDDEEADSCASHAPPRALQQSARPDMQPVLAGKASPAPPKAPVSPRFEAVQGGSRILAAHPKLLSPGQPTPDFFGGLKRLARTGALADRAGARELLSDGSLASPGDSAGSSAGSSRSSTRGAPGQHALKENAQPWR